MSKLSTHAIMAQPKAFRAFRNIYRKLYSKNEREMDFLPFIAPRDRAAMDVGANRGLYTEALSSLGISVVAIEPNPDLVVLLERMFPSVRVICAAVSDAAGEATLRIPVNSDGEATISDENDFDGAANFRSITVPTVRIDDVAPANVGFIKIDVEGHELSALRGCINTIVRDRPNLLVEAEERHRTNAIQSIRELLEPLGYRGFFIWNGTMVSVSGFNEQIHQNTAGRVGEKIDERPYANNFIFLPTEVGAQ